MSLHSLAEKSFFFFLRTLITVWQLFSISPQRTQLYLLEDTAAVIQMIMKDEAQTGGTAQERTELIWMDYVNEPICIIQLSS